MRIQNDLPKSSAINGLAVSQRIALPPQHLPPQIHKHMNHAEELARPQKKRQIPRRREETMAQFQTPPRKELGIQQCGSQRHSGSPGSSDFGRREQVSQGGEVC